MKIFLVVFVLLAMGCNRSEPAPLSPEFKKSAKFAFALLQQANEGQRVSQSDVSRAFAEMQAEAQNSDEKMATYILDRYRLDLEYRAMTQSTEELRQKMQQEKCEIDKMLTENMHGTNAMSACGEKLSQ